MKKKAAKEYLEQAQALSYDEAEQVLSRMSWKLERRMENRKLEPVEAVAIQLELEDEQLREWRQRWTEISLREAKKAGKKA